MGAASAASRAANDSVVVDASALQVEINTNEDDNRNGENMDGDVEGGSGEVPRNSTDLMDQACCPVPSVVTRRGSKANDDDPIIDVDRPLSGHGVFEGSGSLSSVVSDHLRRLRDEPVAFLSGFAYTVLPCLTWMPKLTRQEAISDSIAGITVGVMMIPQSMAYAMIAGMPTVYGLYAGFLPVLVYALTGTSRQLAVGPVALVSLLTQSALSARLPDHVTCVGVASPADSAGCQEYVNAALGLSFLVGIIMVAMGVTQLGFLVSFLSHSVISGFTSAAAILIGSTQLKHVVGYDIKRGHALQDTLKYGFKNIEKFHGLTFGMAVVWVFMLLTFKNLGKNVAADANASRFQLPERYRNYVKLLRPLGPLIVCIVATVTSRVADVKSHGVKIVGYIPGGLPGFMQPDLSQAGTLYMDALVISFVGFMESIAIAKSLAARNRYELNSNQELLGIGLSNLIGGCFGSYPITGSFSRSAVNNDTGAKTSLSGLITALVVMLTLLALTELFYFLPRNALAAIVISSVLGLVDTAEAQFLWKVRRFDFVLWIISFCGTLFLGVELGIAISVGMSLIFVIYETARPHTAILGKLPNTTVYRSVAQYPNAETHEGIVIMRIDAPLFFANVDYVKDKFREFEFVSYEMHRLNSINTKLRGVPHFVILEMGPVASIDSTGVHALSEIIREYKRRNVQLAISNPNGTVLRTLERADVVTAVGRDWLFTRVVDAVAACERAMNDIEEPAVAPRLAGTGRGGSWLRVQAMLEKNGSPDKMRVRRSEENRQG